ncbi:MAG: alkaline phosphatase family protein [Gemmatimonadales bacterium]
MMLSEVPLGLVVAGCVVAAACGGKPLRKKVLLIGLDGVRVDILQEAYTPNIDALIENGVYRDDAETRPPTVSGPGWSSMLMGVWSDKHLVTSNNFTGNDYADYPDFLTRLELTYSTLNTFAVLDWPPLGTTSSGGPLLSDAIDFKINIDGDELGYAVADSQSITAAVRYIEDQDPDAVFVYIGNIDVVGHESGSLSAEYRAAVEVADGQVGQLMRAVERRRTRDQEDWLILVSTDHGRRDDGGHGGSSKKERTIFYLASGTSISHAKLQTAPQIVDIAVTALEHMGVDVDAAWRLDGKVVGIKGR